MQDFYPFLINRFNILVKVTAETRIILRALRKISATITRPIKMNGFLEIENEGVCRILMLKIFKRYRSV